ncbi:unnamed protein product [Ceratitis capitata]|uniref:(Mediterranean fruit fly) hypothetical protein n=1 Tax=Ceratitis capitata TaxID=7213 RepID=A0A811VK63_CERCA|nr:unnamed protein product [Ceratitis capitata]
MTTDVNRTDGQMDELKSCEGSTPTKSHELQVTDLPQPGKRIKSVSKSNIKDGGGDADDFDAWIKSRQLLKPDDQLDLTEAELGEEITKVLTTTNTNVIQNLVVYSFKESAFVQVPVAGNTVTLMEMDGSALHIDSDEAKIQMEETGEIGYPLPTLTGSFIEVEEDRASRITKGPDEDEEGEEKAAAQAAKEGKMR